MSLVDQELTLNRMNITSGSRTYNKIMDVTSGSRTYNKIMDVTSGSRTCTKHDACH